MNQQLFSGNLLGVGQSAASKCILILTIRGLQEQGKTLSCWHHLQRKTGIKAALIYPKYTGYLVIFCLWSKSKEYIIRTISYINHHSRLFRVHTYWCHMGRQSLDSSNSSETPSPRKSSLQLPNVPMWSSHLWCQPCHLLNHGKSNSIL